jgi:hypothetical protein
MSPARARGTRRAQLETDVAAGARCADSDEDWFREPGESTQSWVIRREGLRSECAHCPILAQCQELALRYDANLYDPERDRGDVMVRGGLTAKQITTTSRSEQHASSLAKAVLADRRAAAEAAAEDPERTRINALTQQLRDVSVRHLDPRYRGKGPHHRRTSADITREAAHELRALRTARRRRNGWTKAA